MACLEPHQEVERLAIAGAPQEDFDAEQAMIAAADKLSKDRFLDEWSHLRAHEQRLEAPPALKPRDDTHVDEKHLRRRDESLVEIACIGLHERDNAILGQERDPLLNGRSLDAGLLADFGCVEQLTGAGGQQSEKGTKLTQLRDSGGRGDVLLDERANVVIEIAHGVELRPRMQLRPAAAREECSRCNPGALQLGYRQGVQPEVVRPP